MTHPKRAIAPAVTRKGRPFYPQQIRIMNPKLIPILQRIIARDSVLSSFEARRLPLSARAYVRQLYRMDDAFTPDEQDLIETLPPFADDISETFRDGFGGDASIYHLFDDGSLWVKTNAYSSVWADATDYAVEILLPRMELSRMDADFLRAIEMEDAVESVRADFYSSFAQVLHRDCGIPFCDAREHWDAYSRQLGDSEREKAELGGRDSGTREGNLFAESFKSETLRA
mgnify:CR=1 FL=1